MKFEVSERVRTTAAKKDVLAGLEQQFKKVSANVGREGSSLVVKSIEASFGSINRSDTTTVEVRDVEDGFLLIAYVHYRPSVAFWIILIISLFSWVFWIIPIVFYLIQKKTVQTGIQEVFTRIRNEFMSSEGGKAKRQESSDLDQLQKLAQLRDSGVLSEEEFQIKKAQILGPPASTRWLSAGAVYPAATQQQLPPQPPVDDTVVSCPHCEGAILMRSLVVGSNICPHCQQTFEAE